MEVIIEEAIPEYAKERIEYSKRIGSETDNLSFGKEGFPISVEDEKEYIRAVGNDDKSVEYFAWKNGVLIGSASLSGLPRRMNYRATLGLTVIKAEWNNGIGTRLLEKVIGYAKQHGIEIIDLEVRSDNVRAIHLYQKFGFVKIGTFPKYFKIGNSYADCDIMYLDLQK